MNKKYLIIILVITAISVTFFFLTKWKSKASEEPTSLNQLTPIEEITHGHGMSVDVADSSKLYIATHHGLLVLKNDKELYKVGDKNDDYMGFASHPTDPQVFFSSGHPASGGNIGFQKSQDGGFTWNKISDGLDGPVDFHALAVSPVNTSLIYGWFKGELQRSFDEGKNWQRFPTGFPVVNLVADPEDENILYAASSQGLFTSKNKGVTWEQLLDGFVSAVTINPQNSQMLLSFSEKNGLAKSSDSGLTWEKLNETFSGETPLFISFYKEDPNIVYSLTEKNSIYKSTDNGNSWNKIF